MDGEITIGFADSRFVKLLGASSETNVPTTKPIKPIVMIDNAAKEIYIFLFDDHDDDDDVGASFFGEVCLPLKLPENGDV